MHPFDHFELAFETRAVFDRDHAFLADFVHRVGDDLADLWITVRRDRTDLGDLLVVLQGFESFFSSSTVASTALSMPA